MFRLLKKSLTMPIQPSDFWVGMAWDWALTSPFLAEISHLNPVFIRLRRTQFLQKRFGKRFNKRGRQEIKNFPR